MARKVSILLVFVGCLAAWLTALLEARQANGRVAVDADDIGGVVTGASGPEAGVWVIAETTTLPTKFAKIVVTDDAGRYVLPDLPRATYRVWVRGYGLVDSAPVSATPGRALNLRAVTAPDARSAAQIYPANYWFSMVELPAGEPRGCGLNCHQIGTKATREIPKELGVFDSTHAAWERRVQVGQAASWMAGILRRPGHLAAFANWTDRIAAGAVPAVSPPRPTGVERNIVTTLWDWGTETEFVHDAIASDKRNPSVNAHGPYYAVASGSDGLLWIDPLEHKPTHIKMPGINLTLKEYGLLGNSVKVPSPYYGSELYWDNPGYPHNPMMDQKGRVWTTTTIRHPSKQPSFCTAESNNKFARYFPASGATKHVTVYDPAARRWDAIDTCFTTHHLIFGYDRDNTLYFSNTGDSDSGKVGWINTRVFDETKSAEQAQGWCPAVLDTNGDGKITRPWTEPKEPVDPTKDHRVLVPSYGMGVSPADGSVWHASGPAITRVELGSNPPETCRAERYEAPPNTAFSPRGVDIDRNGVAWVNFAESGHFGSFDRRKCKVLNGPTATGRHCPEGWTFYELPGPKMAGRPNESADFTYISWVDHFNVFGLGENVPMAHGSNGDVIYALLPQTKQWVLIRVPYPLGFYPRSNDVRIDDPQAGWKGRGLWTNYASIANWHTEGGKGTKSKAVKIQLRPNPLAK